MTPTVTDLGPTTAQASPAAAPLPGLRPAVGADAGAIHRLIEENLADGHLLPRTASDIAAHVRRFVVVEETGQVIGCAELAPLSRAVAEVRSLVVHADWRGRGLGTRLIDDLSARARLAGFAVLCAFTHAPQQFVRLGFSIVPHVWFPEKVALDCTGCAKFRRCGQHAMALPLTATTLLPTPGRLREPLTAGASHSSALDALRPVRLRVIA